MSFFKNLFSREPSSAQLAKQRLQVVLVQDHLKMAPGTLEAIKADIMQVLSRHLDIDPTGIHIAVERRGHGDEVVANIPVRRSLGRARMAEPPPAPRPALAGAGARGGSATSTRSGARRRSGR